MNIKEANFVKRFIFVLSRCNSGTTFAPMQLKNYIHMQCNSWGSLKCSVMRKTKNFSKYFGQQSQENKKVEVS